MVAESKHRKRENTHQQQKKMVPDVHIRFMGGFTPYFQELDRPSRIQVPSEVIAEVEHKDWDEGLCFHEIRSRILW